MSNECLHLEPKMSKEYAKTLYSGSHIRLCYLVMNYSDSSISNSELKFRRI